MRTQHRKNQQARRPPRTRTYVFDDEHVLQPQMRLRGEQGTVIEITDNCAKGDQSCNWPCGLGKERQQRGYYPARIAENLNGAALKTLTSTTSPLARLL